MTGHGGTVVVYQSHRLVTLVDLPSCVWGRVCARASAASRAGTAAMLKLTAKKYSFGSVIVLGCSFSAPPIDYTRTCFDFFSSPSLLSPPLSYTRACFDFFLGSAR